MLKFIRLFLVVSFFITSYTTIRAQSFERGDMLIGAGIKISIYNVKNDNENDNNDDKAASYTIPIAFDYALSNKFGAGIELGICNYFTGEDSITRAIAKANSFDILLKGDFHWVRASRLDLSSGIGLGVSAFKYESNDNVSSEFKSTGFYFRLSMVNFKVYFSDHIGMYASMGIPYMNFENGRITDSLGSDFSYPLSFAGFDIGTGLVVKF